MVLPVLEVLETRKPKYILHTTHDVLIAHTLYGFIQYNPEIIPYNANLIFDVVREEGELFVRISFMDKDYHWEEIGKFMKRKEGLLTQNEIDD